jgi:hypothetical protein
MQLSELVGQVVLAIIPKLHPSTIQKVKLLGVESGGIWIQSQAATNAILQIIGTPSAPRTLAFFVPYHEIQIVMHSLDEPSLNEKAFDV